MLEMGPGEPNIACLPEPTPADALRVRALNAGPRRILLANASVVWRCRAACSASYCSRAWSPTMRGSFLARVHCARWGHGRAIFAGKAHLPRHAILGIGVREPGDALLAHRARHDLPLPVDEKLRFVEARARAGLPTGVVGHGADEGDAIRRWLSTRTWESYSPYRPSVRQAATPAAPGTHDSLQHMIIRRRGGCRLDIDNQMRGRGVAGFRQMDLIADPLDRAFRAVPGLRIIRGGDQFRGDGMSLTSRQLSVPLTSTYCSAQTRRRVRPRGPPATRAARWPRQ